MKISDRAAITISSFFYIGYLPLVPGTFGSLAGLGLIYILRNNSPSAYLTTGLAITLLGFLVSGKAEKALGKKDCRYIVIDEVAGIFLSLAFLPCGGPQVFIAGFILFRLLDTFKPYPAGSFEKMPGSSGIMSDDLVAGAYTNIILQVVLRLASCSAS